MSWSGRSVGALTLGTWVAGASALFGGCGDKTRDFDSVQPGASGEGATPGSAGEAQGGSKGVAGSHSASGAGAEASEGGSGAVPQGVAGAGGDPSLPDDEAPTVVALSPDLGEVGVASDAAIEITFSEPMDKVTTQAAFQSANLGGVTFDWPSDDVMVITPNAPLAYATGTSLAVAAKTYGFSLTTTAEDLAGNALEVATTSEFSTLRQLTMTVPRSDKYYEYDDGAVRTLMHPALTEGVLVGDAYYVPASNNEWVRALIAFDLAGLPIGIEGFLGASLSVTICCATGNPTALGGIHVDHVHVFPVTNEMTGVTPLSSVGLLTATPSNGEKTVDVVAAVANAYEQRVARNQQLQFRFQFEPATDDDTTSDSVELDEVASGPNAARIGVTFLIP